MRNEASEKPKTMLKWIMNSNKSCQPYAFCVYSVFIQIYYGSNTLVWFKYTISWTKWDKIFRIKVNKVRYQGLAFYYSYISVLRAMSIINVSNVARYTKKKRSWTIIRTNMPFMKIMMKNRKSRWCIYL